MNRIVVVGTIYYAYAFKNFQLFFFFAPEKNVQTQTFM